MNWKQINLDTYAALQNLYATTARDPLMQDITALAIITNYPESYFETIPLCKLTKHRRSLKSLIETPVGKYDPDSFRCNLRKFYAPKGIENYKGEHLEGVSLLKLNEKNIAENIAKILAVISTEQKSMLTRIYTFTEKVEHFSRFVPASVGVPICNRFLTELGELSRAYGERPRKVSADQIDNSGEPDFSKHTMTLHEHWGYFHVFFELAGRDRTKMDYWRDQTIPYIFNSLAHRKDLSDDEK